MSSQENNKLHEGRDLCWFHSLMYLLPLEHHLTNIIDYMKATPTSSMAFHRTLTLPGLSFSSESQGGSGLSSQSTLCWPFSHGFKYCPCAHDCQVFLASPELSLECWQPICHAYLDASNLSQLKQTDEVPFPFLSYRFTPIKHTHRQNFFLSHFPISMNGATIHPNLGVMLDSSLSLYPHIQSTSKIFSSTLKLFPNSNYLFLHMFLKSSSKPHHFSSGLLQ